MFLLECFMLIMQVINFVLDVHFYLEQYFSFLLNVAILTCALSALTLLLLYCYSDVCMMYVTCKKSTYYYYPHNGSSNMPHHLVYKILWLLKSGEESPS